MATFEYAGVDEGGVERRGRVEADGMLEASEALRAQGIQSSALEPVKPEIAPPPLGDVDAFVFFNRSLAEMTRLGIPAARAVREVASMLRRGRFRSALERLEASLREGRDLDEAAEGLPAEFPPYYRWMLKAGAASGNLPGVLSAVARNAEGIRRARRSLIAALTYPALVLVLAIVFTGVFLWSFLPVYQEMCRQVSLEPSVTVKVLIAAFGEQWIPPVVVAGFAALALAFWAWSRRTVAGERFLLRVPILGRIRRHLLLARLLGTLGALLRARTPLPKALPVALGASGSLGLRRMTERIRALAEEGDGLAAALEGTAVVPPELGTYLALAERTGRLPETCGELADLSTDLATEGSDTLFLALFPLAILATGVVMAALFMSLVIPYMEFVKGLAK